MKITVTASALQRALKRIYGVIEKKTTIPILTNVKMEIGGAGLTLTGTDLDRLATTSIAGDDPSSGATTVNATFLHDFIAKLPKDASVLLEQKSAKDPLVVKAGRSRMTLHTLNIEDFPTLTGPTDGAKFKVTAGACRLLFGRAAFAISTEETRYYLNGVYFHLNNADTNSPKLRAVATDGHRLARVDADVPPGAEAMASVIVPRTTVTELLKLLPDDDAADVEVHLTPTSIEFSLADVTLRSKLIDGQFPDYSRVVPQNNPFLATIERASLLAAVDRVSTVTSDRGRAVKLSFTATTVVASVNNADSGSATEEVEIVYQGDPIEIGFNSAYIREILEELPSEHVLLRLESPGSPALLRGVGDDAALFVLMPMRV